MSVIGFYLPDRAFKVTLPQMYKAITSAPSDGEISALYEGANDTLKICIALSAFGSLRRGEISALKYGDIRPGAVYVHADFVKDTAGEWIYKPPKKPDSVRLAPLPQAVIDMLGQGDPDDFIIKWKPDTITKRFIEHRNNYNTSIRFHDLRHYYASIGAALGIPDLYLAESGGWKQNSKVLKSVYQNKITPISEAFEKKLNDHFSEQIRKDAR
jgi:integrase